MPWLVIVNLDLKKALLRSEGVRRYCVKGHIWRLLHLDASNDNFCIVKYNHENDTE